MQTLPERYTCPVAGEILDTAQRRKALDLVLASRTFRRAELLKRLLTYLVEQDEAGRSGEITEYELGIKVLGRMESFTPETDSSVRTRIHALRQKLDEYYRMEAPSANPRIELPRGSYIPSFTEISLEATPTATPEELPVETPLQSKPLPWGWHTACALLAVGVILWFGGWLQPGARWRIAPDVWSFWKPLIDSGQPVVISVAQPVHVWIRDMHDQPNAILYRPFPDPAPSSPEFRTYYQKRHPIESNSRLVVHPSPNATLWGDAAGAGRAAAFLASLGVSTDLVPEGTLTSETAIRGRPLLLFGRPEFSSMADRYLQAAGGYTVGMLPEIQQFAIYRPSDHADRFLNSATPNEVNYGLITVMTEGQDRDSGRRVIAFNGITSDGSVAGIDFLTSPAAMKSLWEIFRHEGLTDWPRVFQVVVRTNSSIGYVMDIKYEKHLVIQR